MKILFFIALFINMVFFLWEINSADLNAPLANTSNNKEVKQILLVSELSKNNEKNNIIIADNYSISNESEQLAVEGLNISKEISINDEILSHLEQKGELEQPILQEATDNITVINRTESDEKNPLPKQKVLVEADRGDGENVLAEKKSFWPDFAFIFDKENNYSSKINKNSGSQELFENTRVTDVGSSSFSAALKKWSVSFFGQPSNKDDGVHISQQSDNILKKTQEQTKKSYCYEVGPFVSSLAIEKWRKSNKIKKDSLKKFNINKQVVSSYLVYHPAEDSFEKSKKIAKIYKKKRLSEVWLFRKGDLRGAISFGLFKKEKSAIKLQKKLIKNGLNVEIIERHKTQLVQYAQILTKDQTSKSKLIISELQTINECS